MRFRSVMLLPALIAAACDAPQPEGMPKTQGRQGRLAARVEVPAFTFLESHDEVLSREHLAGKVWICSFIFTRCKTHCPPMAFEMSELQDEFLDEEFRILSVSVDPAYDQPEVMAEYLKNYDGRPGRWFFVTGKRPQVVAFASAMKINSDPEEPLNHSVYFALVDKRGLVRDYYSQKDPERMKTLREDIRTLLAE